MNRPTDPDDQDGFFIPRTDRLSFAAGPPTRPECTECARLRQVNAALLQACQETVATLRRLRDTRPEAWDALVDPDLCSAWDALKAAVAAATSEEGAESKDSERPRLAFDPDPHGTKASGVESLDLRAGGVERITPPDP